MSDPLLAAFGACTDEVHADLATALEATRAMGLAWVELTECWGKPATALSETEIDEVCRLLDRYHTRVNAVGSLFLKSVVLGQVPPGGVANDKHFQRDLGILRASIRVARRVGAPLVRTFSFRRDDMIGLGNPSPRLPGGGAIPDAILAEIMAGLRIAADEAGAAGLVLGLENVRSCWANTGVNAGRVLRAASHPALGAIWDPANDFVSGGDPAEGYRAVHGSICHVHVKDARVLDPATGLIAWTAVGAGEVDLVGQFAALRRDGYAGSLSLETHWHPRAPDGGEPDRVADSATSFAGVRAALEASLALT
jgi:L-ribulose-5-phosphate 3-epimerase